jgi:hypothetical protein
VIPAFFDSIVGDTFETTSARVRAKIVDESSLSNQLSSLGGICEKFWWRDLYQLLSFWGEIEQQLLLPRYTGAARSDSSQRAKCTFSKTGRAF